MFDTKHRNTFGRLSLWAPLSHISHCSTIASITLRSKFHTAAMRNGQERSSAGVNANAKELSFNPTASEWKPGPIESRVEDVGGKLMGHL